MYFSDIGKLGIPLNCSEQLTFIDPFEEQKQTALLSSLPAVRTLADFLHAAKRDKDTFIDFLQVSD